MARDSARDESIDTLRGAVMVLMALDHARDFIGSHAVSPTDLAHTSAALFSTRWITHYCAPVFVLLAGVSASLAGRSRSPGEASRLLLTRGLWLVFLELTVVRFGWLFNVNYRFSFVQVIWAIGWSMVALAALSRLGPRVCTAVGALMILGHNALDRVHAGDIGGASWLWRVLHEPGRLEPLAGHRVYIAYPLIPWVGVMALGFGLGPLLQRDAPARRRLLLTLGAALTLAFVVLRAVNRYGDPARWIVPARPAFAALSFLNTTKYPPSLAYLLMTLGPALLAWGALTGRSLPGTAALRTFGRVPLFFYVLHLPLLHALAGVWVIAQGGWSAVEAASRSDNGAGGSLPTVYALWLLGIALLLPACRWFDGVKSRHRGAWWTHYT